MCSCTNSDPTKCDCCAYGCERCTCSCHRHWITPQEPLTDDWIALEVKQGPREPLDEKDAEIERLRRMLAYVARCLSAEAFSLPDHTNLAPDMALMVRQAERDYVASIAMYIAGRIGTVELTDVFVGEQTMERLYDAVQASLDERN